MTLLILLVAIFIIGSNPNTRDIITHDSSTNLRFEQYNRIWNQRLEIGLLGRGVGAAGPSSQNRLDININRWTENTYLDIFEELGFIGFLLYNTSILWLLYLSYCSSNTPEEKTALLMSISFLFTGMFINYYTGQIAIFLFWLINGIALKEKYG